MIIYRTNHPARKRKYIMENVQRTGPQPATANMAFHSVPLAILGIAHLVCLAAIAMAIS